MSELDLNKGCVVVNDPMSKHLLTDLDLDRTRTTHSQPVSLSSFPFLPPNQMQTYPFHDILMAASHLLYYGLGGGAKNQEGGIGIIGESSKSSTLLCTCTYVRTELNV